MISRAVAVLAILLLSAPSALGVQRALAPTRGDAAGWLAAVGIELTYIATVLLSAAPDLARHARRVALVGVFTAILLNALADYAARVPAGLTDTRTFLATFDVLSVALSVIESAPLAGLAYALALLTHHAAARMASMSQVATCDISHMSQPVTSDMSHGASDMSQVTHVATSETHDMSRASQPVTSDMSHVTSVTSNMSQEAIRQRAQDIARQRNVTLRHAYRLARQEAARSNGSHVAT